VVFDPLISKVNSVPLINTHLIFKQMVRFIRYIYITQIDSVNSRKVIGMMYTPLFYLVVVNKITYTNLLVYPYIVYQVIICYSSILVI